jgi:Rrf2 family protein
MFGVAMRFSSQEEYGLRCLLQIAREPAGALTIPEIAEREALTPAYVAKLMGMLRRGELVKSTRGQKGGYRLACPPEQISVGMVLAALGGRIYSEDFCGRHAGNGRICVHNVDCSIRSLWMAVDSVVQRTLSQTMLSDLFRSEQAMHGWGLIQMEATPAAGARSLDGLLVGPAQS